MVTGMKVAIFWDEYILITLMMEMVSSSETSVNMYQTT